MGERPTNNPQQEMSRIEADTRPLAPSRHVAPSRAALLPDREPQDDTQDNVEPIKDVMAQMEHPFYSLSKKPETSVRRYEHNGNWLEITPSVKGLATIYDKDILIYCISQLMAKLKRGEQVSQRVRINSHELLVFTNRGTSGRDYMALVEALDRLEGTRIRTNIMTGDEEQIDGFGLIDASSIRRKQGLDGRLLWCEVKLSDWVFNAIRANEVLTLHPDYFTLRKPLERRVYEIARKHCGHQDKWRIGLDTLLKKTGSQSPLKRFRQTIRHLATHDHLPDYSVSFDLDRNMVAFRNRGTMTPELPPPWDGRLPPQAYEDARAAAPGWDIYDLESQWREWLVAKKIEPAYPAGNFVKFCLSWYERRGPSR